MRTTTFKLLAAGILLASGLGLGLGNGGLPIAGAEQPNATPAGKAATDPNALQDDLGRALEAPDGRLLWQLSKAEGPSAHTKKWDYEFVEVTDLSQTKFVAFLQDREERGWEFIGSTPMPVNGHPSNVWVFRRARAGSATSYLQDFFDSGTVGGPKGTKSPYANQPDHANRTGRPAATDRAAIEAEISRLQKQLASLPRKRVTMTNSELPLPPSEMVPLMSKLAEKRFTTRPVVFSWDNNGLYVEGEMEAVDWAVGLIKKLAEK